MRIEVVFDILDGTPYHRPTVDAVRHAAGAAHVNVDLRVARTGSIDDAWLANPPDAMVIGPGSPYDVPAAAEEAIRTAREQGIPLVGT